MISLSKNRARVSDEIVPQNASREIRITYVPQSQLENVLSTNQNHVLALIEYGRVRSPLTDPTHLSVSVNMEQLNETPLAEVWTSPLPISTHKVNGVHIAFNEEVVFGHVQCEGLGGTDLEETDLEEIVNAAYLRIFDTISLLGYPSLVRIWNYFPAINSEKKGLEQYKRFCIGRHRAFSERFKEYKSILPAASAVGTPSGPFQLYFLAGKPKAIHIENPRQISAYDYPQLYGPKSPSFARGTIIPSPSLSYLFVAGTASIVGHATQHKDDCFKQTVESLANLESLVKHAKKANGEVFGSQSSLSLLKVYLRHHQHLKVIRETVEKCFGYQPSVLYLGGEMCRKDLLVEIEALYVLEHSQ